MENKINETLIFDNDSLVFIDNKTKGYKTLQKILDKKNIKWTSKITIGVTYIVCTRHKTDNFYQTNDIYILNPQWKNAPINIKEKFHTVTKSEILIDSITGYNSYNRWYNKKFNRKEFIGYTDSNGLKVGKFIIDKSFNSFHGKRIYSYNEFKRAIENENRSKIEDTEDSVISLLKSKDSTNIKLAVVLIEQYKMDKKWIPWLKLNQHIKEVRLLLRKLGISYPGTYNRRKWIKSEIDYPISTLDVPKEYKMEFIKSIYENE